MRYTRHPFKIRLSSTGTPINSFRLFKALALSVKIFELIYNILVCEIDRASDEKLIKLSFTNVPSIQITAKILNTANTIANDMTDGDGSSTYAAMSFTIMPNI